MIHDKIKEEVKKAMIEKDSVKLNTLRGLLSSFVNELIAKGIKPQETISDEDALAVIKRAVKQRKDSIEQFKGGGRNDLVEDEEKELAILDEWLPQMASEEEIRKVALQKKEELKIEDKSKLGILIGAVVKELKGQADGKLVKEIVDSLF